MKKLISVIMAVAMMISVSVVALAATTLPAAVDGVITLTEDVVLAEQLVIESPLTINLNGHKLTTYANEGNYDVVVKSALTINGEGSVHVSGTYGFGLSSSGTGSLTIENGTFTSADTTYYMIGGFGGKVTIKDGSFTTPYCVVNSFDGYSCPVEITGGEFTVTGDEETAAPILGGNDETGEVKVSGGTFSDTLPTEYLFPGKIQDKNNGTVREPLDPTVDCDLGGASFATGEAYEFTVKVRYNDLDTKITPLDLFFALDGSNVKLEEKNGDEWTEVSGNEITITGIGADVEYDFRVTCSEEGKYTYSASLSQSSATGASYIETYDDIDGSYVVKGVADNSSSGSSSSGSSSGSSSAPSSRPSRDDDDDDDDEGVTDIVPGNKKPEGEENPNTGAPIMLPIATAVAALCGLYISKKK